MSSAVDAFDYAELLQNEMNTRAEGQPLATEKAQALTANMSSIADQVRAIRDYVAQNIRVAGPAYYTLPLAELSLADVTLESGYGHGADVAILLKAMLAGAGIASEWVLIDSDRVSGETYPVALDMFGTVLVKVLDGEATYYLNDGSQYSELQATEAEDYWMVDLAARTWKQLVPDAGYGRRISNVFDMEILQDGSARVTVETEYFGTTVEGVRKQYAEMTPEKRRRHVLEVVSGYSRSAVLEGEYEVDTEAYPGRRRFRVLIRDWAVETGAFLNIRLPGASDTAVAPRYGARVLPFYRESSLILDDAWTVRLPEGATAVALRPEVLNLHLNDGATALETESATTAEDGRIRVHVKRRAALGRTLFGPEVYETYMKAALKVQGRAGDTVIVRMKP